MADPAELLARLRPLRSPPTDGTAEALTMALIGALVGAGVAFGILFALRRRRPVRRAALAALEAARVLPGPERLVAQARLLRETAAKLDPAAAALSGEAWLARLDALLSTQLFSAGAGRACGDALYRPRGDDPSQMLDRELQRLFEKLPR